MAVSMMLGLQPWIANIKDNQYLAAKRAIKTGQTCDTWSCQFTVGPERGVWWGSGEEKAGTVRIFVQLSFARWLCY